MVQPIINICISFTGTYRCVTLHFCDCFHFQGNIFIKSVNYGVNTSLFTSKESIELKKNILRGVMFRNIGTTLTQNYLIN